MPAKLASPVKVEYAWLDLDDLLSRLEAPRERIASIRDPEEEEQIRRSMEEDPQGFFDRSPILLTACRDRLFLGDGGGRLQVAKQLKIAKVRARIEHYESEDEAYLAAVDASYIINSARGRVPPHSRVSYAAFLKSRGLPAKAVAARMKIDEKTVYHLWKISESAELMEKLRKGEISLREAVNLAYAASEEERRSLTRETIYKSFAPGPGRGAGRRGGPRPVEKQRRGGAERGEKREAAGEVGLEKYSKRDVMREVESAVSALASDERDRKALLRDAEKIFGAVEPELAIEAVRIWRDSGGAMTFQEALEKAKRGEVAEEEGAMEEEYKCPECGNILICPHCGWPRGDDR